MPSGLRLKNTVGILIPKQSFWRDKFNWFLHLPSSNLGAGWKPRDFALLYIELSEALTSILKTSVEIQYDYVHENKRTILS